ncbi:hypothetical protein [Salinisphaera sp. G21_0]|uniref:hypothetical protein n=1 Tax=Salinisphaera sp. G21_0 TaxID=2821094 RepID=UPI001ADC31E1|nr:hypothetical protein [Salinisphaera sp. G21_0]MBO9481819.1 hypothetical protein [Salinisphaera sp. G21_0]
MDAGARATQERLPVGQSILGQPPGCLFRWLMSLYQPATSAGEYHGKYNNQ